MIIKFLVTSTYIFAQIKERKDFDFWLNYPDPGSANKWRLLAAGHMLSALSCFKRFKLMSRLEIVKAKMITFVVVRKEQNATGVIGRLYIFAQTHFSQLCLKRVFIRVRYQAIIICFFKQKLALILKENPCALFQFYQFLIHTNFFT